MFAHIGARLMHQADDLRRLISEDWQQPTLAAELEVAAARIGERCSGMRNLDAEAARQWAMTLAGEVGALGIVLAAVRRKGRNTAPSRRAEEWVRLAFDRRLAQALAMSPAEAVLLDPSDAEHTIAAYADSIGDIEQEMEGELRTPDPLIAREQDAPIAAPAAAPETAHPQTAAPEGEAAAGIVDWIADWLARAFDRPAETITARDLFSEFGMDSVRAMMLISALEDRTGADLPPTLIWDYPSLGALAEHVAALERRPSGIGDASPAALAAKVERLSPDEMRALLAHLPEA
jgi:acyl carrier protein